jgi:hypothetical protein
MTKEAVDAAIAALETWGRTVDNWVLICAAGVAVFLAAEVVFSVAHWINERNLRPLRVLQSNFHVKELITLGKSADEAKERAAQAELALEKYKAPRSISVELRNRIVEQMKQFAPQEYMGRVSAGSYDAWDLWREISLALELAGWKRIPPIPPVGQPPYGPPATTALAAMPGLLIWYPALNPIAWNGIRPRAEALAKAIRDGGNGVLANAGPMTDSSSTIVIEIGPNPHPPASAYHGPDGP